MNFSYYRIGFTEKGSLWVAQTSDRLHTLKRQYAIIKALGINCEILNVEKLKAKLPIIDPHEVWVMNRFELLFIDCLLFGL
jgi:L-2-hydroxyglutarate oxidase LhgO